MKKIFLALLMVASLSVCGYSRDVRVVLKNGLERKGELTATNEDSVFIKFKNGKVRKIPFTEITSVIDVKTKTDILGTIQAEGKIPAEETPAEAETPAAAAPAAPEAAVSAAQANPAVRVVMKTGPERKGLLVATDEDSIFVKFKNGKTRKILIAEIASVIDTQTNKDILSSIQAESKTTAEAPAGDEAAATDEAPASAKAQTAEKGSAVLDVAASFTPTASKQKGLPDNLMGWMAARYGSKTMLGLKWENPNKAKIEYVAENKAALAYALANPMIASKPGVRRVSARKKPITGRLDLMPFAKDMDADTTVDSHRDIKYAGPGAPWNIGYIKSSKTTEEFIYDYSYANNILTTDDGTKYRQTEASVLFGSFVLTLPVENFAYYAFAGPAIVSYDYTETGSHTTDTDLYVFPFTSTSTPGVYDAKKSGTAVTWILGLGMSLRLTDSGFGLFGEYKYIPESGDYLGLSCMGAGLSFGF